MQQGSIQTLDARVTATRSHAVPVLTALTLAMIFLQKFAINFGGGSIGYDAFFVWLALGWLFLRREAGLVPVRAMLLMVFLLLLTVSVILSIGESRLTAVAIVLFMYLPFVALVPLSRAETLRLYGVFQTAMAVIAVIVLLQQVTQYTVGNRFWPNLDAIVPERLLYPGFAYIRPYSWNSPYLTPNGVFFLEPSAVSSYLALAIAVEMVFFQRIRWLVLYSVAVIAGVAASGPASILVALPFLAWRTTPRIRRLIGLGALALTLLLLAGAGLRPLDRVSELSTENSSGYERIIRPLQAMAEDIRKPDIVFVGAGAGASPKGDNQVQWPVTKLLHEYGLIVAITFHLFFLIAVFDGPPARAVAAVLVIPFLFFGGGFVAHASTMPMLLFGSLIRIRGTPGLVS